MVSDGFNILSLCAGGGGLELGIGLVVPSARTVCVVEREAFCLEVLASARESLGLGAPLGWTDLRTFDGRRWRGAVDCVVAGIPCQPHSVAGKRLGAADERNLWPDAQRVIGECRPGWVFLENVGGAVAFFGEHVVGGLEAMGYRVEAGLFTAAEVGTPHRRERLFVLGYLADAREGNDGGRGQGRDLDSGREAEAVGQEGPDGLDDLREVVDHAPGARCNEARRGQPPEPEGGECLPCDGCNGMVYAECARRAKTGTRAKQHPRGKPEARGGVLADAERRGRGENVGAAPTRRPDIGTRIPLFPPGPADLDAWREVLAIRPDLEPATQCELRGVADGLASRLDRLRMLGNGVVPLAAAYAFSTLLARHWRRVKAASEKGSL